VIVFAAFDKLNCRAGRPQAAGGILNDATGGAPMIASGAFHTRHLLTIECFPAGAGQAQTKIEFLRDGDQHGNPSFRYS
jgi:hypothetical protein